MLRGLLGRAAAVAHGVASAPLGWWPELPARARLGGGGSGGAAVGSTRALAGVAPLPRCEADELALHLIPRLVLPWRARPAVAAPVPAPAFEEGKGLTR